MTSNFASANRSRSGKAAGETPTTSRSGWKRSMASPRSRQRAATSSARIGEAVRSASNSSMPAKCAAAMASSLSSSVPATETVAMLLRTGVPNPRCG